MSGTATTFQVSDKTAQKHHFGEISNKFPKNGIIQGLPHYRRNKCTEVLQSTQFPSRVFASDNGFVHTVVDCYNQHYNLIVRPDDIWAAIMTQLSFYVNKNAEEFRSKFVDFEGKKELAVQIPGSLRNAPYDLFVKLMSKEIDRNLVDPEVKKWILPNFSTTTDNDLVSVGVVFMATMKKYFDYKCCLMCGIPSVTLEGTTEDWVNIHNRLEKLKEYNLQKWYDMLEPVLTQFINAKKGKVDRDFWKKICHWQSGGSGPSYLSGWITAFCVFDKEGNWQKSHFNANVFTQGLDDYTKDLADRWPRIETDDIPTGIVEVDVKIDDNGVAEYKSIMFAGHLATEVMEDGCTLKPTLGWGMALKPDVDPEEAEELTD